MSWLAASLALVALFVMPAAPDDKPVELAAGQRWAYETRPQDAGSTLVIGKVDELPQIGRVIHVHVLGLTIPNPAAPGGISRTIGHMPFSEQAFRTSVTRLIGKAPHDDVFDQGYAEWQKNHGGVFTIPVRDAVDLMDRTINAPAKAPAEPSPPGSPPAN